MKRPATVGKTPESEFRSAFLKNRAFREILVAGAVTFVVFCYILDQTVKGAFVRSYTRTEYVSCISDMVTISAMSTFET